ncbi:putative oxidoreductase [Janibacter sp. HTCC2649]|uniref:SDR family NAD(P)-dependent oxidoreductase n=1 Tax=Janibacter sp. HTCC2649 TaxID=313589 RepID=UPI0000671882|nr:SDR family NAD(P)-dependent oxidoreductase [Janibacter sp. HTCC2649]EAP98095.1 putative oxidoreductase [Janibacter sp. HTCC2649]
MAEPRTIVITGASDGIGAAAAGQLQALGHEVVLVGRSPEKTAAVASRLNAPSHVADFADLDQVRALAADLLAAHPRIDVLANNAGGVFAQESTKDGFDKTFQVNHLAPFLLTHLLMDRLVESDASVIQTASAAHRLFGNIDLDDLDNARNWSANKAYGDGKLANVLFTRELHRRFHDRGVNAVAFHPGVIRTNFANDTPSLMRFVYRTPLARLLTGVESGGGRLTWLAAGIPGETWEPGRYYENNKPAKINPQVKDAALAQGLWERSEALLGL